MSEVNRSKSEKVVARRAFDTAYRRECDAILAELKEKIVKATEPKHIWEIHDYLTEQRESIDEKHDYRYSVLTFVFARLLNEGWLKQSDLEGVGKDKIKEIEKWLKRY